jgi:hypothetical protein
MGQGLGRFVEPQMSDNTLTEYGKSSSLQLHISSSVSMHSPTHASFTIRYRWLSRGFYIMFVLASPLRDRVRTVKV